MKITKVNNLLIDGPEWPLTDAEAEYLVNAGKIKRCGSQGNPHHIGVEEGIVVYHVNVYVDRGVNTISAFVAEAMRACEEPVSDLYRCPVNDSGRHERGMDGKCIHCKPGGGPA